MTVIPSLVLLDWDGTLCPSTPNTLDQLSDTEQKNYVSVCNKLLEQAQQQSTVVIVTNAQSGWITACQKKWLNGLRVFEVDNLFSLVSYLSKPVPQHVVAISAQHIVGSLSIYPSTWKEYLFHYLLSNVSSKQVIGIGDNPSVDRIALHSLKWRTWFSKSVLLQEHVNATHLSLFHSKLIEQWQTILNHQGNLDLVIHLTGKEEQKHL